MLQLISVSPQLPIRVSEVNIYNPRATTPSQLELAPIFMRTGKGVAFAANCWRKVLESEFLANSARFDLVHHIYGCLGSAAGGQRLIRFMVHRW